MDAYLKDKSKDTLLLVHGIAKRDLTYFLEAKDELEAKLGRLVKVVVVIEKRDKTSQTDYYPKDFDILSIRTDSILSVERALNPYIDRLCCVMVTQDKGMPYFKRIIPHVPYVPTPTMESIDWSSNKLSMRRRLVAFDPELSPPYIVVEEVSDAILKKIRSVVGFPLVVKPAGLAASALVSICYHEEELEKTLRKSLRKMKAVYRRKGHLTEPQLLVESFMEGEMYSTDIYVDDRGNSYETPLVHIRTGFSIGRDDFYGYKQTTPVNLAVHKHEKAFDVAKKSVRAMALRNTTVHVELMKTEKGWKVIELQARAGGFRHALYMQSYGINHLLNDMLIRLPAKPVIPKKILGHSTTMKMYPREEGEILAIKGIRKLKEFKSYVKHEKNISIGGVSRSAKNGGRSVLDIYLFNENRSDLLADVRRVEKNLNIVVESKRPSARVKEIMRDAVESIGI